MYVPIIADEARCQLAPHGIGAYHLHYGQESVRDTGAVV